MAADHGGLPVKDFSLVRGSMACLVAVIVMMALDGAAHLLMAQAAFGGPVSAVKSEIGGLVGWLVDRQSEFYREISAALRAAKADGSEAWSLLVVSFAYGILHAAGPGSGKVLIASFRVADRETAWRAIALSFASALLRTLVAIALVAACAWLLNVSAKTACGAGKAIEIGSYALIAAFGASLVWTKGGGFIGALQAARPEPAIALAADQARRGGRDLRDPDRGHGRGLEFAGPDGRGRRGLAASVSAAGIRPSIGSILVLVFALAQGLFWTGIAAVFVMGLGAVLAVAAIAVVATSASDLARRLSAAGDGSGGLIMRGIEFGAAGLVLLFGSALLFGYIAAERATCI
jgi:nickel/cobalt transporter (NicO) family protein